MRKFSVNASLVRAGHKWAHETTRDETPRYTRLDVPGQLGCTIDRTSKAVSIARARALADSEQ